MSLGPAKNDHVRPLGLAKILGRNEERINNYVSRVIPAYKFNPKSRNSLSISQFDSPRKLFLESSFSCGGQPRY